MDHDTARHRHGPCVDEHGQRDRWCACWWDGRDEGYVHGIAYATAHPDPAVVGDRARDWLHAAAVEVTRGVADRIGDRDHHERRAREAAGLARARARWERPPGGDAA